MAKRLNYEIGFTGDTSQLKSAIDSAVASLNKLGTAASSRTTTELKQAADAALQLEMHLRNATNVQTGKLDLSAFDRSLKQSGMTLDAYARKLQLLGIEGQSAFANMAAAVASAELPMRRSSAILNQLWITMKNTARWQLTSSVLHGFIGAVRTAYGYTKDLNESLNSIRIVTSKSVEDMDKFAQKANEAAKTLSTTTTRYTDASLIYFQQGLDEEQVEQRAAVTIKLANAAGEAADTASQQLTAIWNNFYDGSKSLEYYADVMTALGASTASSTEEISTGLQKFAAVAQNVGLSYEYAASALATITATTRESAETVGTALRTIFGRLESLKLGETLDDDTTLKKYSQALLQVGVNIKDSSGDLKDMDTILDETMDKWKDLSRDQQVALAQAVAGVRQYAQFMALMNSSDFFKKNLETAYSSEGALQKQADIYAESWEAASARVRAAAEEIYSSLINDKSFIKLTDDWAKALDVINDVVKSLGGLPGILKTLGTIGLVVFKDQLAGGLRDLVFNLTSFTGVAEKAAIKLKEDAINAATAMNTTDSAVSSLLGVQNNALRTVGNIEIEIFKNQKSFTDLQAQQVQNDLALLKSTKDRLDLLVEQTKEMERQANTLEEVLRETSRAHTTARYNQEMGQGPNSARAAREKLLAGVFKPSNGVFNEEFASTLDINNIIDQYRECKIKAADAAEEQRKLNRQLEDAKIKFGEASDQVTKANNALKQATEKTNDLDRTVQALSRLLASRFKAGDSNVSNYIEVLTKDLRISREEAEHLGQVIKDFSEKAKDDIHGLTIATVDWANAFIAVGQAISGISMGFNAIKQLIEVFNDENATASERIAKSLTAIVSLTYAIRPISMGLGTLKKTVTQIGINSLAAKEAAQGLGQAMGAAGTAAGAASGAISGAGGAVGGTSAAFAAGAATVGIWVAAIAAAVGVIVLIYRHYNKFAIAAKEASKKHEEAAKAAQTASDAYKDLLSTIEGYDEAVKSLEDLTVGTKEYQAAVERANESAKELLKTHKELEGKYKYNVSTGLIEFDSSTLDETAAKDYYAKQDLSRFEILKKIDSANAEINKIIETGSHELGISYELLTDLLSDSRADETIYLTEKQHDTFAKVKANYNKAVQEYNNILQSASQDLLGPIFQGAKITDEIFSGYAEQIFAKSYSGYRSQAEAQLQREGKLFQFDKSLVSNWFVDDSFMDDLTTEFSNLTGFKKFEYGSKAEEFIDRLIHHSDVTMQNQEGEKVYYTIEQMVEQVNDQKTEVVAEQKALEDAEKGISSLKDLLLAKTENLDVVQSILGVISGDELNFSRLAPSVAEEMLKVLKDGSVEDLLSNMGNNAGKDFINYFSEQLSAVDSKQKIAKAFSDSVQATAEGVGKIGDAAKKTAYDMLKKIGQGNLLDGSDIEILKQAFEGISDIDFSNFDKLNVNDQIAVLSGLANDATDSIKEQEKAIEKLEKELENIEDKDYRIQLGFEISEAYKKLERLKNQIENDPWKINFEVKSKSGEILGDVREIVAEAENVKKAFGLINKDLEIRSENFAEFVQRYPEALNEINWEPTKNVIKVNQDMYDKIRGMVETDLDAKRDAAAEQYLIELQKEADILEVMSIAETAKQGEITKTVTKAVEGDADKEAAAKSAAFRISIATIKEAIKQRAANKETTDEHNDNVKAGEQTTINALQSIDKASYNAATNFQSYFAQAIAHTSEKFSQWANDPSKIKDATVTAIQSGFAVEGDSEVVHPDDIAAKREEEKTPEEKQIDNKLDWLLTVFEKIENGELEQTEGLNSLIGVYANDLGKAGVLTADEVSQIVDTAMKGAQGNNSFNTNTRGFDASKQEGADRRLTLAEIIAMLSGGKELNNRGDGSGSNPTKKLVEEKTEKEEDRYHKINRLIEEQDRELSNLEKTKARAFGSNRLTEYDKTIAAINKQMEYHNDKLNEAQKTWLPRDTADVMAQFENATYDEATDRITNIHDLVQQSIDEMNEAVDAYNKWKDEYNALGDQDPALQNTAEAKERKEEADHAYKEAKNLYDQRRKMLSQYEETVDLIAELEDNIADDLRKRADEALGKINYQLEVVVTIKDLKKQINEFSKSISESVGDALTHTRANGWLEGVADLNKKNTQLELDMYDQYANTFQQLTEQLKDPHANVDEIRSSIQDLTGKIIESGDALLEWLDYWENMVPEAVDAASERISQLTNQLVHNASVLSNIKELYALQDVTTRTKEGFEAYKELAQASLDAAVGQSVVNKDWFEGLQEPLKNAKAMLDSLRGDETDIRYDAYKKAYDALLEESQQAELAYLESAKQALEIAKEMYVDELKKAKQEFSEAISGEQDLDFGQEQFNNYIEEESRWLDEVNRAYQDETWERKISQDLDKAKSQTQKDILKTFAEQKKELFARNKIDEDDLKILEAKYQLAQAEMELEDKKQAKNKLKLVRDSQGNWNYQFVADQDEIADAEQKVADKTNELYNLTKEISQRISSEIYDLQVELSEKIQEIMANEELSLEERNRRIAYWEDYYSRKAEDLYVKRDKAMREMTQAGEKSITSYQATYETKLTQMTGNNEKFQNALAVYMANCKSALTSYQTTVKTVTTETGTDFNTLKQRVKEAKQENDNLRQAGQLLAAQMSSMVSTIYNQMTAWSSYAQQVQGVISKLQELARQAMIALEALAKLNAAMGVETPTGDLSAEWNAARVNGASWEEQAAILARRQVKENGMSEEEAANIMATGLLTGMAWVSNLNPNKGGNGSQDQTFVQDVIDFVNDVYNGNSSFSTKDFNAFLSAYGYTEDQVRKKIKQLGYAYDTGGYTGVWGSEDGKLAFLHQKELVLNAADTENLLAAVGVVRDITRQLDSNTKESMGLLSMVLGAQGAAAANSIPAQELEQTIHIDEISFPNITSADGIEEAFRNLADNASQWVSRRRG